MDKETKVENLMGVSIDKIKQMVDVSTVVGDPIPLSGGTTLIPVSKVSYGFASGGSDLPTKGEKDLFGGGGGAGINITPIAFIAVSNGDRPGAAAGLQPRFQQPDRQSSPRTREQGLRPLQKEKGENRGDHGGGRQGFRHRYGHPDRKLRNRTSFFARRHTVS